MQCPTDLESFLLLLHTLMLQLLLDQSRLLGLDLLLQLVDLVVHDLQLPLVLRDLILQIWYQQS